MIAAVTAFVLALSGCLGGGPSNGDVSKVRSALEALGPGWTVEFVDELCDRILRALITSLRLGCTTTSSIGVRRT